MRGSAVQPTTGAEVPPTPFRRVRMDDDMWTRFGEAITQAEPELDRSKVIREFVRWYLGETNDLPRRPHEKAADPQAKNREAQG